MKRTKKIVALLLAAVLLVTGSVAATIAYLTASTNVVNNTFTVGHVAIELDEVQVDPYGVPSTYVEDEDGNKVWTADENAPRVKANTYKLVPGHNYTKDPEVRVTKGSEQCYVFVKVVNGLEEAEAATTIADQMTANKWLPLPNVADVYYYNGVVDARNAEVTLPVFAEFTLKGDVNVETYKTTSITIDAYAVQADGMTSAADAWSKAEGTWEN